MELTEKSLSIEEIVFEKNMVGARARLFKEASPAKLLGELRSCAALSKKIHQRECKHMLLR